MAENADAHGSVPPYGQAIWDAAKRGDLHEMEHIADAARIAMAKGAQEKGVEVQHLTSQAAGHFHAVASHEAVEVREALTGLEKKISELRAKHGGEPKPPQGDPPAQ